MQQINEHSIMEVLKSNEDYKNSKFIKTAIAEKNRSSYDIVCQTLKKVLDSGPEITPNVKLLAFRLCKDAIEANNREFIEHFENILLPSFQRYVEYKAPTDELSRGATFFSPNPDKDLRQLSISIIRLALDIVLVLAMQYPDDLHQKNQPSKSFLFYMEMKMNKKVHFPIFAYFKQDKVDERKHPDYDRYEVQFHSGTLKLQDFQGQQRQIIQQPQMLQSHPTPQGPTPGNVVQSHVNKINEHIDNIFSRIALTCGKFHLNNYDKIRFQDIENEVAAINGQMDDIMQNMGDDPQAEQLYSKLEQMLQLEQDLDEYKSTKQFWPQFRLKYIGNAHDVEKELNDKAHRDQEKLERQKEEEQLQLLISKQKFREEEERQEQLKSQQLKQEQLRQEEQQRQERIRQEQEQQRLEQIKQEQLRQEQQRHHEEQIRLERIRQEQIRQEEIRKQQELEQLKQQEEQRMLSQQFYQSESQQNIAASKIHHSQQVQKPYEDQNPYMDKYHEIIEQQEQQPKSQIQQSQIQQSQIQGPTSKKPTSMTSKRGKSPISGLVGHSGDAHQTIPEIYHPDHLIKQSQIQSQFQQSIQNQDIQKVQQQPSEYDQQLIRDLKTQLDQKQIENHVLKSQLDQRQLELSQSQQQVTDLKLDLQEHQIQKRLDQQMIAQLQNQLQSHNPQQAQSLIETQLHQQINALNKEHDLLQARLDQERNHVKDLEFKLRNKQAENDDLLQKLNKLSIDMKDMQNQHDQYLRNHQSQIQSQTVQQQQSFEQQLALSRSENEQLKKQIQKLQDFINKQQDNDLQTKHNTVQQELQLIKRHLQDEKNEKDKLIQTHQDQIEQHKYTADESKRMIDMLKNQVNTLNMKNDKLQKDFELQSEKHKKSKEEIYQQVVDAKKESMTKQQQIDQMSFQLNDKQEDLKQLQIQFKASEQENIQLKKNNDAQQQQITQFMEMINKQSSNKGNPIYQQKLQQALDEIDQLKEQHQKELQVLKQQNKELQQKLIEEREQFQVQLLQQQQYHQPVIIPIQNIQNEQLISNQPPEELNFQSSNQKPQSVSNQNISDKLSIKSNKQLPLQKPCPLPQFKHFPPTSSFKWRQNVRQDKRAASDDYFDIIFPFQNPKEYYQNKQQKLRKGRITHANQFMIDVAHLDQNNQRLFKQRALGTNGLLYLNKDLQIGINQQIQVRQGSQYYTYGLYLTNISRKSINLQFVVLEDEKFQTLWAQPQQIVKTLQDQEQILVEMIAQHQEPVQLPIIAQIQINQDHPFQILLPNNIVQMITYKDIKKVDFQQKWKSFVNQIIRTDLLITNNDVFESIENLQQMIPQLIVLNSHKLQEYEIGIDEIKLGGYAQIQDTTFYIKFEFLPDDRLCIFVTYDNKYSKNRGLIEKILQSYSQLLGSGQSQDQ